MKKVVLVMVVGLIILVGGCGSPRIVSYAAGPTLVSFPDSNFEAAIRDSIMNDSDLVLSWDLEDITHLSASGRNIIDISGIEYCKNLGFVYLNHNRITDISPLADLPGYLTHATNNGVLERSYTSLVLGLSYNEITDISSLVKLAGIDELYLYLNGNRIKDFTPLAELTNLVGLYLQNTGISDVTPLAGLTNLVILDLQCNLIHDISPLSNLTAEILLSS